ncbi:MAG: gamma-glutamylcyclotransferase [Gammaproteobacteria bacterium]|nr:MAG: gamma-glutamylcyclotransferase [Gammaproteobacteria bacterium]
MGKLFSYGTLQQAEVQQSTFGRLLHGVGDSLTGYRLGAVKITDISVVKQSGSDTQPILRFTGNLIDQIEGTVFDVTPDDLVQADEYEVTDYHRISVTLKSGMNAWIYVAKDAGQ